MKKLLDRAGAKIIEAKHEDFLKVEFVVLILNSGSLPSSFRFHYELIWVRVNLNCIDAYATLE